MHYINIAFADDHNLVRAGVSNLIDSFGRFRVTIQANNGKELIDKLHGSVELPEICIVDVSMPVMNGYDTVAKIKSLWPEMKILAFSMLDTEYCVIKMLSCGATAYVIKNEDPAILHRALIELHEQGYYNSELISNRLFHAILKKKSIIPELKDQEIQLLKYIGTDLTYSKIAEQLNISVRTIENCRDSLFDKFKVTSRPSLVLFAIRLGIIPIH